MKDDKLESTYSSAAFHPDGLILGTGMVNSTVVVWEARSPKVLPVLTGAVLTRASAEPDLARRLHEYQRTCTRPSFKVRCLCLP